MAWFVSKFKVLKFLLVTSIMIAGSLTSTSKRFWFLNKHGLLYLLTLCILLVNLYSQMSFIMTPMKMSPPKKLAPVKTNADLSSGGFQAGAGSGSGTGLGLPNNDKGQMEMEEPVEVVRLSKDSSQILNNIMNLVMRLIGFILFPDIVKMVQRLLSRSTFVSVSYQWTRHELIFLVLIVLSCIIQMEQTISETIRRLGFGDEFSHGENRNDTIINRGPPHRIKARQTFGLLMEFIYCFILESFPIECVTFALVLFTMVVSKNLEELKNYLEGDPSHSNSGDPNPTVGPPPPYDLDSLVVFNLSNEFPVLGRMVNIPPNNRHKNNNGNDQGKNTHVSNRIDHAKKSSTHNKSNNNNNNMSASESRIFFIKTKTKVEIKAGPPLVTLSSDRNTNQISFYNGKGFENCKSNIMNEYIYNDYNSISHLFRRYFELFDLWKETEIITGFATFLIFLNATINLCIYSFMSISGYLDMGALHESTITMGLRCFLSIGKLLTLTNAAQTILNAGEELEEKILLEYWNFTPPEKKPQTESAKMRSESRRRTHNAISKFSQLSSPSLEPSSSAASSSSASSESQLLYLLHHMSQNTISLSALGFFTASRSTFVSIGGVILSYLFVLIQFRSSS